MNDRPYQLFWGILHCHVSCDICHKLEPFDQDDLKKLDSDVDELYDFVINDRNLDFIVYADHHNMGDMIRLGHSENSPWQIISEKADKYNRDGSFVALKGYEFQDGMEYNVYLRDDRKLPVADKWVDLIKTVTAEDTDIVLAAHNRPCPTDWQFDVHPRFRMIEIINDGGVFEGWANQGLAMGHRAGFYAGSDDHSCQPAKNAITGVWAKSLTADAVWDAIQNRRTIATTNIRTSLFFQLNDQPLGSVISNGDFPSRHLQVYHRADTTPLLAVIIKNGEMVHQIVPDSPALDISFHDETEHSAADYYYVKVVYPDGRMAFSSPIWVVKEEHEGATRQVVPTKAYPVCEEWRLVDEFAEHVGYHRFTNAGGLCFPEINVPKRSRDMVCHIGPDALLVTKRNSIVYPAMDGIYERFPNGQAERLKSLDKAHYHWLLTAFTEFDNRIVATGYSRGDHLIFSLKGNDLDSAVLQVCPIRPYFYQLKLVTPQYLASDGIFLYWLLEHECVAMIGNGQCLGTCQEDFPAFPCAVAAASLNRICILSCDKRLVCYDLSSSQEGRVVWDVSVPEYCCSLTVHGDELWAYNDKVSQLSIKSGVPISVFSLQNGDFKGLVKPDLKNIRGTRIAFLDNTRFVALHNPDMRASANYRDILNEKGTLRVFEKIENTNGY